MFFLPQTQKSQSECGNKETDGESNLRPNGALERLEILASEDGQLQGQNAGVRKSAVCRDWEDGGLWAGSLAALGSLCPFPSGKTVPTVPASPGLWVALRESRQHSVQGLAP